MEPVREGWLAPRTSITDRTYIPRERPATSTSYARALSTKSGQYLSPTFFTVVSPPNWKERRHKRVCQYPFRHHINEAFTSAAEATHCRSRKRFISNDQRRTAHIDRRSASVLLSRLVGQISGESTCDRRSASHHVTCCQRLLMGASTEQSCFCSNAGAG